MNGELVGTFVRVTGFILIVALTLYVFACIITRAVLRTKQEFDRVKEEKEEEEG